MFLMLESQKDSESVATVKDEPPSSTSVCQDNQQPTRKQCYDHYRHGLILLFVIGVCI